MPIAVIQIQPECAVISEHPVNLSHNPGQPIHILLRRPLTPKLIGVPVVAFAPIRWTGHANGEALGLERTNSASPSKTSWDSILFTFSCLSRRWFSRSARASSISFRAILPVDPSREGGVQMVFELLLDCA